uniref:MGS-like domain-containing protein n=1 Tax=Pyrodinium bahamense TaxID=73915 RepID=A0A7S0AY96_9DINO|mmetsp:Transcript_44794/g.124541  ORF Transcript_44794/g.124541 Transcript_44794/m.124541 type:complete len:1151 (+) Transcript_44794:76-3528(+)
MASATPTESQAFKFEPTARGESDVKATIRKSLRLTLPECFIPELGESKQGKVRDIYFSGQNVLMITNDRVSAFDYILPNLIPFKGQVLNMISEYTMAETRDVLPNALVENVDGSVVVQKKMKNLNVEWIVRGYLWGSMAAAYEKGDRTFCGLNVPDGLIRFQKFDTPLFTPTTKAEVGHDENLSMEQVEALLGKDVAQQAKEAALKLFARGQEIMRKRGLILIDTKYEMGLDEKGVLHVIDEVNTPDSSRLCDVDEWEAKYPKIAAEMAKGEHKTVTDLIKAKPELKMKEFSKQYVRDALLDMGFDPTKHAAAPELSDDQVVECAYRYIAIYERITKRRFPFPETLLQPAKRILHNLQRAGLIAGASVVIIAGSDSDVAHAKAVQGEMAKFKVPSQVRVCSAYTQPSVLESMIKQYNRSIEPLLLVCCCGGADALSSIASSLSVHPVVSCPPGTASSSSMTCSPGCSSSFILSPSNVAKFAAQTFANSCPAIAVALGASIEEGVIRLEKADAAQQRTAAAQPPQAPAGGCKALANGAAAGGHTLRAVGGDVGDMVRVKTVLVSVFDKTGLEEVGGFLAKQGVHILSTGGTAAKLRQLGCTVQDVADYTGSPEILDGRVKTLHPKVHGGLLAARGNAKHEAEMAEHSIRGIDLVIVNLYPFVQAVQKGGDFATCIENIDIGGPAMIRASAKNNNSVAIVTSPTQYPELIRQMTESGGSTSLAFRRNLAAAAYALTAAYDASVSGWFAGQVSSPPAAQPVTFHVERPLKYGCNPHQNPAALCSLAGGKLPFEVMSGTPGYINLLDAVNAWQLVHELAQASGMPAAASFKHVSPAGAAIGVPLSAEEVAVYEVKDKELSPVATAYVRARNADPMCSFGDFVAISHEVDMATANILKIEVSDGIIAPGFQPEALEILKAKKQGKFIVLQADASFTPPAQEYRMVGGVGFVQKRNDELFDSSRLKKIVTKNQDLPQEAKLDLILASISIKYTQSNSVGYAQGGMMIGVGAGQQSRVDCVKLAARKASTWRLRFHPKVMALAFKAGVKRQDRVNARVRYIEGDMQQAESEQWEKNFDAVPAALAAEEKAEFLKGLTGVSVSSDAFFPFRDSIDACSRIGVSYIAQPGGSVADQEVIAACDAYGMAMAFTDLRLFHH